MLLTHFQLVTIYRSRSISAEGTASEPAAPHPLLPIILAPVGDSAPALPVPHLNFQSSFGNSVPASVLAITTSTCSPDLNSLFSRTGYYQN